MNAEIDGKIVRLPDFLLAGAGKSGTTSLYHYLKQHPQIFMPDIKEPKFFAFADKPTCFIHPPWARIIWRFDDYVSLFSPARENQLLGDASTVYLYCYKETIENIKRYLPDRGKLKIIIILRNPVERSFSIYTMYKMADVEPLVFEEAIQPQVIQERMKNNWARGFDYIGLNYYKSVKAYMDEFPHVKIYLYEDLKTNALRLVKDIFKFLDIDYSFIPDIHEKYMVSGIPRFRLIHKILQNPDLTNSPFLMKFIPTKKREAMRNKLLQKNLKRLKMKKETKQYLINFYREDIVMLEKLINRNLSHWLQ